MQDDPNFLPDVGLAPMEMERMDFETTMAEGSQRSTLSPHSSQQVASRVGSQQEIGGLVTPQSASSFVGGPAGGFGGLSVHGSAQGGNEDVMLFDDDLGLIVGDDGALMEDLPLRQGSAVPSRGARTEVSGVSSKLRRDETAGPQGNEAVSLYLSRYYSERILIVHSSASQTMTDSCPFKTMMCLASNLKPIRRDCHPRPSQMHNNSSKRLLRRRPQLRSVAAIARDKKPFLWTRPWSFTTVNSHAGIQITLPIWSRLCATRTLARPLRRQRRMQSSGCWAKATQVR